MPFTPKFVDMVRNLTTSTGTGAINPGSAVSGFTSLSAAVASGEQFYYCIQGVDKPAEREVGRGTMQTNGTIAREAISGALTNFTAGTKTIALVTAAEWFAKVEQGGGNGGGSPTVPGLTELAALPTANGAAAVLTAKGREGLFVFSAANHSALVAADTRQGIHVAPATAATGASGAWVRRFDGPFHLNWFGVAGDFLTDDLPAFNAAVAMIKAYDTTNFEGGGRLVLPQGKFYCSGTWIIDIPVVVEGAGSGQPFGAATIIRFANNVDGIEITGAGSTLEGVQLWGGNANPVSSGSGGFTTNFAQGDSTTGVGVRVSDDFIALKDVAAYFFGEGGFNAVADVSRQANSFYFERCIAQFNRGYGFLIAGADANAGTVNTCSSIQNGGAGFLEYSFLGNSYIQCHVRDCGISDPTGSNGPTGTCQYPTASGVFYYMVAGQEVAASTTVPGTNSAVWRQFGGHPQCKTWVTGLEWVNPSPYGTNPANVNGRNVFLGCYAESAQAPVQATYPSLFLGGLLDEVSVDGSAAWLRGTGAGGVGAGEFVSINPADNQNTTRFGAPDGKTIFEHQRGTTFAKLYGRNDFFGKKSINLLLNNSLDALAIGLEATHPFGYGSIAIGNLWVGTGGGVGSGAISVRTLNAVSDINGQTVAAGTIIFDTSPGAGSPAGWVCTLGGTVGSGAVFADLAPVGLAAGTAAELRAGAATNRFVSPANLFAAAAPVALVDGATVTIDGDSGINFNLTLGGNRTLANPTNMKPGQSGRIRVRQDATGGRTLAFGANWLFAGGDPVLSTAAIAIDVIAYFANSATEIEATIVKALS